MSQTQHKGPFLICDCVGTVNFNLVEGKTQANGRIKFSGPYTEIGRMNRNKRIYPEHVMRPEFDRLARMASNGRLTGELDHPSDSIIHCDRMSHRIMKLEWQTPNIGVGTSMTMGTACGLQLEAIFHEGVPLGVSSRGVGSGARDENGVLVIQDGFQMITFDVVADPSYQDAWQSISESVARDQKKGVVHVSMATPEMIAQERRSGAMPVVSTRIEEAFDSLPLIKRIDDVLSAHAGRVNESAAQDNTDQLLSALSAFGKSIVRT